MNERPKKTIQDPTFCRECGYNLQQLPRAHVCPECGHRYDTRPGRIQGIFEADEVTFPSLEVIGASLAAGMVGVAVVGVIKTNDLSVLFIAGIYTLLTGVLGFRAAQKVQKYNLAKRILDRMDENS